MMYPFLTLDDDTVIVHSEMQQDGTVKVYIEKPDEKDCFHNAYCILPAYKWEQVNGFSECETERYRNITESTAQLIMMSSRKGEGLSSACFDTNNHLTYG